ncbi:glycosyltransferase [Candidatus Roizmanbacteria bacterium]|nr:glycosyltransferase [Candidatus Roizmanbacteria bacterium]
MKVALVHDQLQEFGGAERVLIALKGIFPAADVFTSFYSPASLGKQRGQFADWNITESPLAKIPYLKKFYSPFRFITPLIWKGFDLSAYDVVISSSGSYMSKGVSVKPGALHICYLHHPPRYLYYYETALEWQKYWPIKLYAHLINRDLRIYDYLSSQTVDFFITNSEETKKRINKFYRRDATVIYPPVSIPDKKSLSDNLSLPDHYLTVSRLARAKHIDVLIRAAGRFHFKLKVVGRGRDLDYLRSLAGDTVEFLTDVADDELPELYKKARAFLFAAVDEEFGIAPVEAMGWALPVIALKSGGVPETVREGFNGFLFNKLSPLSLGEEIKKLESLAARDYETLKKNARKTAEKFSPAVFKQRISNFVDEKLKSNARTSRS